MHIRHGINQAGRQRSNAPQRGQVEQKRRQMAEHGHHKPDRVTVGNQAVGGRLGEDDGAVRAKHGHKSDRVTLSNEAMGGRLGEDDGADRMSILRKAWLGKGVRGVREAAHRNPGISAADALEAKQQVDRRQMTEKTAPGLGRG